MRVQGIKRYRDPKTGRWYCYHRKSGTPIKAEFGTAAFFLELQQVEERFAGKKEKPGTLGALIREYRAAPVFQDLAERTRDDYQKVLDYLKPLDAMPLVKFDQPFVAQLRDKTYRKRKRRFANYVVAVLSAMLSFGLERGVVTQNAAKGVKKIRRPKTMDRANPPWPEGVYEIVMEEAPPQLRGPIATGRDTGMREGDVITLKKTAYRNRELEQITRKTGQAVYWPCTDRLAAEIEAQPKHDAITLFANSYGRPWTESGFRASFFKLLRRLEEEGKIPGGLTFHGLRHTIGSEISENGFDDRTVADALGQSTEKQAAHYTRGANLRRKMKGVVDKLDANRKRNNRV